MVGAEQRTVNELDEANVVHELGRSERKCCIVTFNQQ